MKQDQNTKATGRRLSNWLRRPRVTESADSEPLHTKNRPSAALLSDQGLASLKRSYLQRLHDRFHSLYLYGLDDRRQLLQTSGQALDLHALYTTPNVTMQAPTERPATASTQHSPAQQANKSSAEATPSVLDIIGRTERAIVRGPRGSGKTTLLHYLARSLAERSRDGTCTGLSYLGPTWGHGCPLPVWIDLQALVNSPHNNGSAAGLCQWIAAEWRLSADQLRDQLIVPGGLLFLIDDLELAPDATADFYRQFRQTNNQFLLASQVFVDLDDKSLRPLKGLTEITLAPWTPDQMDQFVGRWYAELECKEWIDSEAARDLPGQLRSVLRRDTVRDLARRPALMVLIALLHTMNGQLPTCRVAFYDQLIALCLTYWTEGRARGGVPANDTLRGEPMADNTRLTNPPLAEERDLRQAFDLEALQATIAQITYDRYARLETPADPVELSTSDLRAALINVGREGRAEAADALITRMRNRPALLDERKPGRYVYAHPCLQDHAAAYHLTNQQDLPRLALALAREDYARWHTVIFLAGTRLAELRDNLPAALEMADALCPPPAPDATRKAPSDIRWRLAWLAGEILTEIAQEIEGSKPSSTLECIEAWLITLLDKGHLAPVERAKAGSVLDRLPDGDRRAGVSSPNLLWCPVPAGDFWQGDGQVARKVYVGTFWMSRYPVTNAQYAAFIRATGHPPPGHWQGEHPPAGTGNHPVVQVTWNQANQYCTWYTGRMFSEPFLTWRLDHAEKLDHPPDNVSRNWGVRLPTNQEWEKAARGGVEIPATDTEWMDNPLPRRAYPWSDDWHLSDQSTQGDETKCNVSESNIGTTTPVGMYPNGASPYGLMDMAGNVWEWCLDWADEENRYKMRRGGAYRFTHEHARCAAYDQAHPSLGWPHLGFRVVLALPAK